jgi:hypothetical protein
MAKKKNPYRFPSYSNGHLLLARFGREYFSQIGKLGAAKSAEARRKLKETRPPEETLVPASAWIRADQLHKLRLIARIERVSLSTLVREAVHVYLQLFKDLDCD